MADFVGQALDIVSTLLGPWNKAESKPPKEYRFGSRGSLSLKLPEAVWYDFEREEGGTIIELIDREQGGRPQSIAWLVRHGFGEARSWEARSPETRSPPEPAKPAVNGHRHAPPAPRPQGTGSSPANLKAVYEYTDIDGNLVCQVVRYEWPDPTKPKGYDKTFRQRRPAKPGEQGDKDGWVWNLSGVKPPLYRLSEVVEAIAAGKTVIIAEGEKDVDALWALNIPATTNIGGAGKFQEEFRDIFINAEVAVLPDADKPGQDHIAKVAACVAPVSKRVRVLELPGLGEKEDVSDWLSRGGTAEQFHELLETKGWDWGNPPFKSRFGAVLWHELDEPGPEHAWIIKGLLTDGERSMIVGPSGSGKSFLATDIGLAIAAGAPSWRGRKVRGGMVIYCAGEGGRGVKKRLRAYRQSHGLDPRAKIPFALMTEPVDLFMSDDPTEQFIAECKALKAMYPAAPLRIVFIDTLSSSVPGANENASEDMSRVLKRVTRIAQALGCAVCLVHHLSKAGSPRGHSMIFANLEQVIEVNKLDTIDANARPIRLAKVTKQKDEADLLEIPFVLERVELGRDEDGDPITSCVIAEAVGYEPKKAAAAPSTEKPDDEDLIALAALDAVLAKHGVYNAPGVPPNVKGVEMAEWREALERMLPPKKPDSIVRDRVNYIAGKFAKRKWIGRPRGWVWLMNDPRTPRRGVRPMDDDDSPM